MAPVVCCPALPPPWGGGGGIYILAEKALHLQPATSLIMHHAHEKAMSCGMGGVVLVRVVGAKFPMT